MTVALHSGHQGPVECRYKQASRLARLFEGGIGEADGGAREAAAKPPEGVAPARIVYARRTL